MEDKNKDIELMRQLIEKKKQKSASQNSVQRGPGERFNADSYGKKRNKKEKAESESE